jgi:hypothetical protein
MSVGETYCNLSGCTRPDRLGVELSQEADVGRYADSNRRNHLAEG